MLSVFPETCLHVTGFADENFANYNTIIKTTDNGIPKSLPNYIMQIYYPFAYLLEYLTCAYFIEEAYFLFDDGGEEKFSDAYVETRHRHLEKPSSHA